MLDLSNHEITGLVAPPRVDIVLPRATVEEWTTRALTRVRKNILAEKTALEKEGADFSGRTVSESSLCRFWLITPPPEGFETVIGNVLLIDETGRPVDRIGTDHYFARSFDGEYVICFNMGQFYDKHHSDQAGTALRAGDRIAYYRKLAPGLFTDYGDGLVRLFGTTEEIREKLGLWFRKNPRLKIGD